MRRGLEAHPTREAAEKRAKWYGQGSSFTYVVEEGTRYEPDKPPTGSREPEGAEG